MTVVTKPWRFAIGLAIFLVSLAATSAWAETAADNAVTNVYIETPKHTRVLDLGATPSLMGEGQNYAKYENSNGDALYSMSTTTNWADYGDEIIPVLGEDAGLSTLLRNGYPFDEMHSGLDETRLRFATQVAVWVYHDGDHVLDSAILADEMLDPYGLAKYVRALVAVGRSASDQASEWTGAAPIIMCEGDGRLVKSDGLYKAGPYRVNLNRGEECYISFEDGSPARAEMEDGREETMFEAGECFWIVVPDDVLVWLNPVNFDATAKVTRGNLVRYECAGRNNESERLVGLVPCDMNITTSVRVKFGGMVGEGLNGLLLTSVAIATMLTIGALWIVIGKHKKEGRNER